MKCGRSRRIGGTGLIVMIKGQITEYLGRMFMRMIPVRMRMHFADRQTRQGQGSHEQTGSRHAHRAKEPLLCAAAEGMEGHWEKHALGESQSQ